MMTKENEVSAPAGENQSAIARIKGDEIIITVSIANLQSALLGAWANGAMEPYRIDDPRAFAKAMCHALNDENEIGDTPIHHMLDAAMLSAIENGEGEEIDEDEAEAMAAALKAEQPQ